ncbi:MAG: hypothetical protein AB8G96_05975 [Phycisphaerales bacterium]
MERLSGMAVVDAGHPVVANPAAWLDVCGHAVPSGRLECVATQGLAVVGVVSPAECGPVTGRARESTGGVISDTSAPDTSARDTPATQDTSLGHAADRGTTAGDPFAGGATAGIPAAGVVAAGGPPVWPDERWATWVTRLLRALHAGDAAVPLAWGQAWSRGAAAEWLAAEAVSLGAQLDLGRGALEIAVEVDAPMGLARSEATRFIERLARWIEDPSGVRTCCVSGSIGHRVRIRLVVDGRAAGRTMQVIRDLVASERSSAVGFSIDGPTVPSPTLDRTLLGA